jgi:hypothetical protein
MTPRREFLLFSLALAALVSAFLCESLLGGKVLSPADVLLVQNSFREHGGPAYEPRNRLQIDPVLQFEPWLEFSRAMIRQGRLPLWNSLVGCGAPHLANGQSAVFDPFHAIAYLGPLPDAYAPMAAARLWMAGAGMFLLTRRWGLKTWGRWFAGLTFPFCGFLIVWLLYPNASAALWLPWLLWATDRLLDRPSLVGTSGVALLVGMMLFSGQVQTNAHVLMTISAYAAWWIIRDWRARRQAVRPAVHVLVGIALGIALAAAAIAPLGEYLTQSPVWLDREAERPSPWTITPPRLLDSVCTAMPYAFGSQRRGQPNLAKALGVHNLNESAGGFAGLATLLVLAPLGLIGTWRDWRVRFLALLLAIGFLGGFDLPPVANLLRMLPIVNVIDARRMSLLVAFALTLLGGYGLDGVIGLRSGRGWSRWATLLAGGALALVIAASLVGQFEGTLRAKASAHYAEAAAESIDGEAIVFRTIAERQVRQTLRFVPRYFLFVAAELAACAILIRASRAGHLMPNTASGLLMSLTLLDLFSFGVGLNPAIDRGTAAPSSAVIDYLKREVPPPSRIVAVGSELPPNTLLRYGLADIRNYDSIEMSNNLEMFSRLYEPGRSRTSRRTILWQGVARAERVLRAAGVRAVVGATRPPEGLFDRVDTAGAVWIGRWNDAGGEYFRGGGNGRIVLRLPKSHPAEIVVAETYDDGWRATVDGAPVQPKSNEEGFLCVPVAGDARKVELIYAPIGVRIGVIVSLFALIGIGLLPAVEWLTARHPENLSYSPWSARRSRVRIESLNPPVSSPASPKG